MGKLTVLKVKSLTEPGRYQDGDGLMLFVKSSGARSWVLRAQVDGKRRDIGLGAMKEVSLADARERASEVRKQFRNGIDPVEAKRLEKSARSSIPTFAEAANEVHAELIPTWRNAKHQAQWISTLRTYAFPILGTLPVDQIDAPKIRETLLPIWLDKPETARRTKQRIGAVLDWAHASGFRETEAPMRSISKGLPRQPKQDQHFAAMPYGDIPGLLEKLACRGGIGALALRFLILTAARSGEVRGATWDEINFKDKIWVVPADRMKARKEHMVPLSQTTIEILQQAQASREGLVSDIIFPGLGMRPMSDMTLLKVLKSTHGGIATVHGMRSAFRDWAAEKTATPGDVVEAALAHTVKNKVEAAYRRTNYLEKRRLLMAAWGNFLAPATAKVIALAV